MACMFYISKKKVFSMKKNTLLIQSLLLPLIASSTAFSMDTPQPQTEQTLEIPSVSVNDALIADLPAQGFVTDELAQSVVHPIQDKGLGFFGTLRYFTSTTNKSIVISYLQSGTFDVTNGSHFILLADALNEAVTAEDTDTIATIATLCQSTDKYKKHIHISDELARPCVGILDKKFAQEKNAADEAVQKANQNSITEYDAETLVFIQALGDVVRTHRAKRNAIAAAYDTVITEEQQKLNNTRSRFSVFAHLNRNENIKEEVASLLKSGIIAPANQITALAPASEKIMTAIGNKMDKLPKIAPANLLIDNK